MNYSQAKEFIMGASAFGSVMGLERVRALLERLGNPQDALKFIHIAGTNGKGSVLSYLDSILGAAGYTVGRYSSPPLHSYREVIQVCGVKIEKEALTRHMNTIKAAAGTMLADGLPHPTRFEMEAALAFLYYREKACDLVLLETGMGGLEDATNIVQTSILEIITSVSMDHMAVLGGNLEAIATQKAGIIKADTVVVSIRQNPVTEQVLVQTCRMQNSRLILARRDRLQVLEYGLERQVFNYTSVSGESYTEVVIPLAGIHQFSNAVIAIEAAEALMQLGYPISRAQLMAGFCKTRWNGRMSIVHRNPLVLIDGAHNEDAACQLAESIKLYFSGRRIIYLLGIFRDKEYEKIIRITVPYAEEIITVHVPMLERLMPAAELTEVVRRYHNRVSSSESVEHAVRLAFERAGADDVIIAFGSLSFLGAIENECRREMQINNS